MLGRILAIFWVSFNAFSEPLWTRYSNAPYQEGAFPEVHVSYFRYRFELPANRKIAIRIRGRVPHGRYMTFNLYDATSKSSLGSLPDSRLVVEPSTAPHFPGPEQIYNLWLTPQLNPQLPNQILLPSLSDTTFEIWYRIYLPGVDEQGGVPLPTLEFLDLETQTSLPPLKPLPALPVQSMGLTDFSKLPPKPTEDGDVYFYASRGFGFYNNGDNQYLVSRLDFSREKSFVLLSFKAPSVGKPEPHFHPDVRYFSFCLGSAHTTRTSNCISDNEIHTSSGETFLLIGPHYSDGISVAELCKKKGINFLDKGKNFIPLLIYRNVLTRPGFPGTALLDYSWPPDSKEITHQEAATYYAQHHHIGSYSPVGKQMTLNEVLRWIESR